MDEPCAQYTPGCTQVPYYQIISKNFLEKNQKIFSLDDEFMNFNIQLDENNNVTHEQLLQLIENNIREKYLNQLGEAEYLKLCSKLRLQYAIQETIKKLIESMDENPGNTSLIISEDEEGRMIDINISPAYDLDLSFLLGEEIIDGDYLNKIFYRTTKDGNTDLISLIKEFSDIPGYREKIKDIIARFQDNYLEKIFKKAYENSKVKKFETTEIKEKYGSFIIKKVSELKKAYKEVFLEVDNQINKD